MNRKTVALVFGGRSPEHDVSLVSASGIYEHLDRERWNVLLVGVDREGRPRLGDAELLSGGLDAGAGELVRWPASPHERRLRREADGEALAEPIDVLFPIIHGAGGEDGSLQGLAAFAGIPCVGAGVLGSSLAMDKDRARRVLAADGLPVVRDAVFAGPQARETGLVAEVVADLGYPVFVKPARAGSSVGISRVTGPSELEAALDVATAVDEKIVIEAAVPNPREIEFAVLGHHDVEVSVPGEILPHGEFYDYTAKYKDPESQLLIPAPLPSELVSELRAYAVRAFRALDLCGMARVDFLVSRDDGAIFVNEANTLPGFTPISMYPKLWDATGLPYPQLLDRLIEIALGES